MPPLSDAHDHILRAHNMALTPMQWTNRRKTFNVDILKKHKEAKSYIVGPLECELCLLYNYYIPDNAVTNRTTFGWPSLAAAFLTTTGTSVELFWQVPVEQK